MNDMQYADRVTAEEELAADEAEAEYNEFYQQELERDERERQFAEEAHKRMFEQEEDCDE